MAASKSTVRSQAATFKNRSGATPSLDDAEGWATAQWPVHFVMRVTQASDGFHCCRWHMPLLCGLRRTLCRLQRWSVLVLWLSMMLRWFLLVYATFWHLIQH